MAGTELTLAERGIMRDVVARLRKDGHDAIRWTAAEEGPSQAARDCDAVVALLDRLPTDSAALVAFARALDKPVLGLATADVEVPELIAQLCDVASARDLDGWWAALPGFYEHIRPFSGRLVRDRIPELVKQAGHDVTFRQLTPEERPRFLKQKVANEAKELVAADIGQEKEEVSDLLEVLEAFITARGFSRDELRRVKGHKKQQRGGFSQGFIVEATSQPDDEDAEAAPAATEDPEATTTPTRPGPPAAKAETPETAPIPGARDLDFSYDDVEPEPEEAPDDLAPGREVKAEFFDL